jgi:GDP-L-fucose synthase
MFENKNVLVTGGTGMIGRAVVNKLLKTGAKITVADLYIPDQINENVNYVKVDLRYFDQCQQICKN